MAKEYKVTVDTSMLSNHDPEALEKHMRDLGREGWELKHVTSVPETASDPINASRIYLFWEREAGARAEQPSSDNQSFGALVRKQLGGTSKG
jgi:hypothetical protein